MRDDHFYWLSAWLAYRDKCATSFVPRSGTIANGLTNNFQYKKSQKEPGGGYTATEQDEATYRKPEFVAEHEGRSSYLYNILKLWQAYNKLPDIFGGDSNIKATPRDGWLEGHISQITTLFLQIHDISERVLGDQLDDGSFDHAEAKRIERIVMEEHFTHYPSSIRAKLEHFYALFENYGVPDEPEKEHDVVLLKEASFAKAVEKADAIGYQLFLATKGYTGNILHKQPPSERDLRFTRILNTKRAVDIYALNLRVATKHIDSALLSPVFGFLEAGFKDAFSMLPKCMTIDVTDIPLDDTLTSN